MAIEALYPYIAVAYGTFGLAFGVFLWSRTQVRIDKTRKAIETQVANAVKDIQTRVDERLDAADISDIGTRVDALQAKFTEFADNIPDFDIDPVLERFNTLETTLPDLISSHIDLHMKALQSVEARQVAKFVDELGIEAATEEAKEAIVARMTGRQRFGVKLMTTKVPPSLKKSNPAFAWALDNTRTEIGRYLIESVDGENGGQMGVEEQQRKSGFGVR